MFDHYYAVIMAGGGGTRLWPLSRQNQPKQMLSLVDEHTMFQLSIDRLVKGKRGGLFHPERIYVVTVGEQAAALQAQYPEIPIQNYLLEPMPRGTASVVGLAAIALQKQDPQAVMAVLTSDHLITNVERFHQLLQLAYATAGGDYLVTLGILPTFPSTGYGYIQVGEPLIDTCPDSTSDMQACQAVKFKEKPDETQARAMLADGKHAWNSGMFVWKVERILSEFERQMPALYTGLQQIAISWSTPDRKEVVSKVWQSLQPQTIDYGIMEGARQVAVIPAGGLGWTDIGSWESLFDVLPADIDGNIVRNCQHLTLETKDSLVFGTQKERLVVLMGVENLVVVDTEDVLLICHRERTQQIRQVVNMLRQTKFV
jgi:mannose-1-phosphate guanylyltransferase